MTFNGEDFIVDNKALDIILIKLEEIIEKNLDKETCRSELNKLKMHLKMKKTDHEYMQSTKDEIAISLYNGRNMVKNTHKRP